VLPTLQRDPAFKTPSIAEPAAVAAAGKADLFAPA